VDGGIPVGGNSGTGGVGCAPVGKLIDTAGSSAGVEVGRIPGRRLDAPTGGILRANIGGVSVSVGVDSMRFGELVTVIGGSTGIENGLGRKADVGPSKEGTLKGAVTGRVAGAEKGIVTGKPYAPTGEMGYIGGFSDSLGEEAAGTGGQEGAVRVCTTGADIGVVTGRTVNSSTGEAIEGIKIGGLPG